MKNTSIFIPLILIACLAALIYLFFSALRAAEEDDGRDQDRIVLNENDYKDDTVVPDTLDTRKTGTETVGGKTTGNDFSEYDEAVPEDEKVVRETTTPAGTTTPAPGTKTGSTTAGEKTTTTAPKPTTQPTSPAGRNNGQYLVIAGTFSQLTGANERVAALRVAGFDKARVERFNKGKFAVALAGQTDRYSTASKLAEQIKDRGFEVRVLKRRTK